jgi:anti-sigma factor RsiW
MKACLRYAPMLGARPGELSEEESRELAEHLAACDACQARLADEEALSGMLSEALLAEANRRDFSTFSDEVLARIPAYRTAPPARSAAGAESPGVLSRLGAWARRHRAAAVLSALAPAAVAVALVVYLGGGSPPEQHAALEVSAEGQGATVLETSDGPVVLFGSGDTEGT